MFLGNISMFVEAKNIEKQIVILRIVKSFMTRIGVYVEVIAINGNN